MTVRGPNVDSTLDRLRTSTSSCALQYCLPSQTQTIDQILWQLSGYHFGLSHLKGITRPEVADYQLFSIVDDKSRPRVVVAGLAHCARIHKVAMLGINPQLTLAGTAFDFGVQQTSSTVLESNKATLNMSVPEKRDWMVSERKILKGIFKI